MVKKSTYRSHYRSASIITTIGLTFFILWSSMDISKAFMNKLDGNTNSNSAKKFNEVKENVKTILIWSGHHFHPLAVLDSESFFQKQNCSYQNCIVTKDTNYFGGDLTKFDAIIFNGRQLLADYLPKVRLPNQDFIYFNMEPADVFPVCEDVFDNFFTLTATYKLDSDIVLTYFDVRDKEGNIIGPKTAMEWAPELADKEGEVEIVYKTKAVAWFVSNCQAKSPRLTYAKKLNSALLSYGYTVDIFGKCGTISCPRSEMMLCEDILRNDYYFYFSAENSFCLDYVTEKVITALSNNVIPIVYGRADYNNFLPPNSYIDTRNYTFRELAAWIVKLIKSPKMYQRYFRWKAHYKLSRTNWKQKLCSLCEAINNSQKTVNKNFRTWWNPEFENRC